MNLQTKALYNLLRLNREKDPTLVCEEWQIENLRAVSLEELFSRLKKAGLILDKERFQSFAEECDSPEDLAELLLEHHADPKQHDKMFLLLFECWRRLIPERPSLSIFCDELDHRIFQYDAGLLESDEPIQDMLAELRELFAENEDAGVEKEKILASIDEYSAYDLTGFLIDYISELLDDENYLYAAELIDQFAPFVQEGAWFDFLKARTIAAADPIETNRLMLEILEKDVEPELLFDMLAVQSAFGELPLFLAIVKKLLPLLTTDEEFQDLLDSSAEYFRLRDRDDLETEMKALLAKQLPLNKKTALFAECIKKLEQLQSVQQQ